MTDTDAPPSAKFVHYILDEADRALTSAEIADRSGLPVRTVRRALQDLQDRDAVEQRGPRPRDPGAPLYTAADEEDTDPSRGQRSY
jgi:predicted ArsR family transcriptional regulator